MQQLSPSVQGPPPHGQPPPPHVQGHALPLQPPPPVAVAPVQVHFLWSRSWCRDLHLRHRDSLFLSNNLLLFRSINPIPSLLFKDLLCRVLLFRLLLCRGLLCWTSQQLVKIFLFSSHDFWLSASFAFTLGNISLVLPLVLIPYIWVTSPRSCSEEIVWKLRVPGFIVATLLGTPFL